jgi:hypothetical protein
MSEKRRRRGNKGSKRRSAMGNGVPFAVLKAHPWRCAFFAAASLFLCWAVLTKSLPYALAPASPDLALTLNPNNPEALTAKASKVREQLLALMRLEQGQAGHEARAASKGAEEKAHGTIADLPEAQFETKASPQPQTLREALRANIQELAGRAIASDPLNAAAYRLYAEATASQEQTRALMLEAVRRSRREAYAVFWLLNESYYKGDFTAAVDYADILLRTKPGLSSYVLNFLSNIARSPEGRSLIVQSLADNPGWRKLFLKSLWELFKNDQAGIDLVSDLKNTKGPAASFEIAGYIDRLVWTNAADTAYNVWLQTLPQDRLDNLGLMTDPNFEASSSGSVFGWNIEEGINAVSEFVPAGNSTQERLLHVAFFEGRVRLPEVRQVLLLAPGHYRFEGKLRGSIVGKRGLRWDLRCVSGSHVIGQTDMLMGKSEEWRLFTFEAEVPQGKDCAGQILGLHHDSRSASEELISGEVWFGSWRLERLADRKSTAR